MVGGKSQEAVLFMRIRTRGEDHRSSCTRRRRPGATQKPRAQGDGGDGFGDDDSDNEMAAARRGGGAIEAASGRERNGLRRRCKRTGDDGAATAAAMRTGEGATDDATLRQRDTQGKALEGGSADGYNIQAPLWCDDREATAVTAAERTMR